MIWDKNATHLHTFHWKEKCKKAEYFLFWWTLWVLTQIYPKTRVLKLSLKHMKISTKTTYSYTLLAGKFFHFNGKHYLQTHGTAMGTKTAVSFANIFMAYIKTTTLSKTVFKLTVWKCYIDDIFPYGTY